MKNISKHYFPEFYRKVWHYVKSSNNKKAITITTSNDNNNK